MTVAAHTDDGVPGAAFRDALGAFATGVTVVTTTWEQESHGMTVSAFTSLSLEPPLVIVCLASRSRGCHLIARSGVFAVNVLAAGQANLSARFANRDRPRGSDAFSGVETAPGATGCPVLRGAAAHVDCAVQELHAGGDHTIVIGSVLAAGLRPQAAPLLYHRSSYRRLGRPEAAGPTYQDRVARLSEVTPPVGGRRPTSGAA